MRGGFMYRLHSGGEEKFTLSRLDRETLGMLWRYVNPNLGRLALATLAMLVVTASTLAGPYLAKVAIDDCIKVKDLQGLNLILLIYLAIQGIYWFASYWQSYFSNWVGQRIIYTLRRDLFDKLLSLHLSFHDAEKVGQITARITHDVDSISELITTGIVNFINDILTLIGIVAIMIWMSPKLAAVTFTTVPIILITMWMLGRKIRAAYRQVREKVADLNAEVEESVAGIRVIQALSQESNSVGKFSEFNLKNLKANLKAVFVFAMIFPTMTVLATVGSALVLTFGGMSVVGNEITLGVLMAFLGYVASFFGPLRELSQVYNTFQSAGAGMERVFEYLKKTPSVQETDTPRRPEQGYKGEVTFESVSFRYDDREEVLSDFDMEIVPGEVLAIVGPTGAGKSTIAKLLARLYDVDSGAIKIDGGDVRDMSFSDLRKVVGLVPQDVFLFDGALGENIAYGKEVATEEDVKEAVKVVHADEVTDRLADGLESQVGEGGVKLSGGQKQLVSFARAVLANPKILILDEATSNVDTYTEALIQKSMEQLLKDRTCIIIAHRFSTLKKADRICVLEKGRITDSGTHEELMKQSRTYMALYEKQLHAGT